MLNAIADFNCYGYATFPVYAKDTDKCKAKSPAVKNWKTRKPEELSFGIPEEKKYLACGAYGIVLTDEDLIMDIDPRNFLPNDNPFRRLKHDLGIDITAPVVVTGGNGLHLYFKKPKDIKCSINLKEYPGIDFKTGPGAYVLGPGSDHPSGRKYRIKENSDFSNIPAVPEKLLEILRVTETPLKSGSGFTGGQQEYDRYCAWLRLFPPAIEGKNGDHQTYKAAVKGRDFGLKEEDTLKALLETYNPLCKPAWSEEELATKVKNAYQYASGEAGTEDPKSVFTSSTSAEHWDGEKDEERHWDLDQHGSPRKTLRNAINYFYLWPEFVSTVKYNQFTGDLEVARELPWNDQRGHGKTWTDTDIILLKYYLAKKLRGLEFSLETLWEAAYAAGMRHAYHPVREYVRSIVWDGKERVNTWISEYCGAANNAYTQAVSRKMLIGLIARVFVPGIKFDYCTILEGKQGIGKSTVCSILGGEWYGDIILDPHARDTIDAMRGKWVVELSEMEVTKRADAQALKAFISRTTDRARLAYARAAQDFPRQCVFIGTINPDELGYLSDTTGNRRFWPIRCGDKIHLDELKSVKDQLIAEAYHIFHKKEELYLTGDIASLAEIEQSARMHVDPWQDVIAEWIETEGKDVTEINVPQIYEHILGGQMKNISRSDQCRIGRILCNLGWHKWRPLRGGSRVYVYQRVKNEALFS